MFACVFVCCVNHTGSLYVFDIKYPMDDLVPGPNKLIIVKKPNQTIEGSQQVCLSDGRLPDATPGYVMLITQNYSKEWVKQSAVTGIMRSVKVRKKTWKLQLNTARLVPKGWGTVEWVFEWMEHSELQILHKSPHNPRPCHSKSKGPSAFIQNQQMWSWKENRSPMA